MSDSGVPGRPACELERLRVQVDEVRGICREWARGLDARAACARIDIIVNAASALAHVFADDALTVGLCGAPATYPPPTGLPWCPECRRQQRANFGLTEAEWPDTP